MHRTCTMECRIRNLWRVFQSSAEICDGKMSALKKSEYSFTKSKIVFRATSTTNASFARCECGYFCVAVAFAMNGCKSHPLQCWLRCRSCNCTLRTLTLNALQHISCDKNIAVAIIRCESHFSYYYY